MIDLQTAIQIHDFVLESTGGFKTKGYSESLLDSALNAPFQSVFGQDVFKSVEAKSSTTCIWHHKEPSVQRWKQTDWFDAYALFVGVKRNKADIF